MQDTRTAAEQYFDADPARWYSSPAAYHRANETAQWKRWQTDERALRDFNQQQAQ
jgi:hypothetical protein